MRFTVFSRRGLRGRRWYFNARADGNNKIVLQSEGYVRLIDCMETVRLIKDKAAGATVRVEEGH